MHKIDSLQLSIDSLPLLDFEKYLELAPGIYKGCDSWFFSVDGFGIHYYKKHVDIRLFSMYLEATSNAAQVLNGPIMLPNSDEYIDVDVNPIIRWFVSKNNRIVSVSTLIDGDRGDLLKDDPIRRRYLEIIPTLDNTIKAKGNPKGSEIVSVNTIFQPSGNSKYVRCVITDVGNNLHYYRDMH